MNTQLFKMSTWNEKCLPWFEEQIENNDEFDYFELCDSLLDFEMETVDMYYKKLLRMAKKYKHLTNIVKKAEGNMSRRNNMKSKFGSRYSQYWNDRMEAATTNKIRKRALDTVDQAHEAVSKRILRSFSKNVGEASTSSGHQSSNIMQIEAKKNIDDIFKVLEDVEDVPMAPLRIVDLTSTEFKRMICKVSKETFEEILDKTNLASWSDEKAELMLKKLKECPSSLRSMRSLIRLSVVNPDEFDPEAYPDLLTVETIFTNFLNLLQSPGIQITAKSYERTMAVHAIIPIINALFQMHKNVADIKWLEIETSLTKRHKFDGVIFELSSKNRLTSTLMEFAKAECTDAKRQSDIAKVYHNAKRSMSQIASHVKSPNVPRVFVVLSSNNHLLFEALNLVKDNMYVRRRYARLDMPTSAKDLQKWVTFLPNVFAWRNAVCSSVDLIMNSSDDDLDETYDVSSVGSTP